jgi:hypothetical protein
MNINANTNNAREIFLFIVNISFFDDEGNAFSISALSIPLTSPLLFLYLRAWNITNVIPTNSKITNVIHLEPCIRPAVIGNPFFVAELTAAPTANGLIVEAKHPVPAPIKITNTAVKGPNFAFLKTGIRTGKKAIVSSHIPYVVPPKPNKIIKIGIRRNTLSPSLSTNAVIPASITLNLVRIPRIPPIANTNNIICDL